MSLRKGDERKKEILAVAERLFCTKGYEETSIQEIIDLCGTSKGGFYHHFASKDAVLEALCLKRVQDAAERTETKLTNEMVETERISTVLRGCLPLSEEDAAFMGMILPIISRTEGRSLRTAYQEAIVATFTPLLDREIALAMDREVIAPCCDGVGDILITLMNRLWYEMAMNLLAVDTRAMLYYDILKKYRRCVELLLNAPFASIRLASLPELDHIAGIIAQGGKLS